MLEVRASDLPPGNAHGNSLAKKGCVGIHVRPADSVDDADQPLQEVVAKCLAAIEAWRRLLGERKSGVSGKGVSVRVDLGGCRSQKKQISIVICLYYACLINN